MTIKSRVKRGVFFAAKTGFSLLDLRSERMPGPRILIYHQVGAGLGRQMEVTEVNFRRQLEWIVSNGEVVSLDQALSQLGTEGSDRRFVLTFDDGYEDIHRLAWPIMRDMQLPFLLYLTTNPTETGESLFPGGGAEPITWAQVDEMLESGLMTLGAHTHRHLELGRMKVEEIEEEIGLSNELIVKRSGVTPTHFAYPWGYWSEAADPVLRRSYETATLGSGAPIGPDTDRFQLNRVPVQLTDGMAFFKRKMTTGLLLEDRIRRRMAGYEGP